jgi:hypothetical protein
MQSYKKDIEKVIETISLKFIEDIGNKYNINKDELTKMWNGDNVEKDKEDNLYKMSKKELESKCKEFGINTKGKKAELIKRIESNGSNIVQKIQTSITNIVIKKNKFNNYEHMPTAFVFNKSTKTVIGKQSESGDIIELTSDDIELCNEFKFKFKIPDKLNPELSEEEIDDFDAETEDDSEESDDD